MIQFQINNSGQIIKNKPKYLVRGDRLIVEIDWSDHECGDILVKPFESITLEGKLPGNFNGDPLAWCYEWKLKIDEFGKFCSRGLFKLDSKRLKDLIKEDMEIELQGEFQFENGNTGEVITSQEFSLIIRNDVIKGYVDEEEEPIDYTDGVGSLIMFDCEPSEKDLVGRLFHDNSWRIKEDFPKLWEKKKDDEGCEESEDGLSFRINGFHVPSAHGGRFPRAANASRGVGSAQTDAVQRVQGAVGGVVSDAGGKYVQSGSLYWSNGYGFGTNSAVGNALNAATVNLDNGREARTASETRPTNVAVWFLIQFCTDFEREQLLKEKYGNQ